MGGASMRAVRIEVEAAAAAPNQFLLVDLEQAFHKLDECIREMDDVTAAPRPDMARLATARFRLSQASNARRLLVREACARLHCAAPEHRRAAIRKLQSETASYFQASTDHIRNWPPAEVERNWAAYREASRMIRVRMRMVMRAERRLLLPLLRTPPGQ